MNIYDYYIMDYNKFKQKLQKQNQSNIKLKLKLETTRV